MGRKPRILLATIILASAIAADTLLAHGRAGQWLADRTAPVLAPAVAAISHANAWMVVILSRSDLATENLRLRAETELLRGAAADMEALQRELEFTRTAAGIRNRLSSDPVEAGIFSWYRAGGASLANINRGEQDGVAVGDIVITAGGSLVGVVRDVFNKHATVTILGDPTLQAAARIMGTDIRGLVHVGEDGLVMDLVQKDEFVTEGQIIVTGGNDRFPAGLVIGIVRSVDATQATLFSIVRVDSAITLPLDDRVLVIRP